MGYVGKALGDRKFWLRVVGLSALGALNLADVLSVMFAPPGYFQLWVLRVTLGAGLVIGIVAATGHSRLQKSEKAIIREQQEFEERRLRELAAYVTQQPDFQTHCFCCRHYNVTTTACMREIRNSKARKVRFGTPFYYCLYWEAKKGMAGE